MLISEITKAAASTGWEITTSALTTSAITSAVFNVTNSTGAGGTAGKLILSVAEGVASDVAGNTNTATASNFEINTLIQLTLTNEYQVGLSPVVGGNNEVVVQASLGAAITLPGQGTLTRAGHTFAGWSLVKTNGSGEVLGSSYTPTVPVKLYSSWTPNVYVVTFNANGGNGSPDSATVRRNSCKNWLYICRLVNHGRWRCHCKSLCANSLNYFIRPLDSRNLCDNF
jgi:hypothetical protein